MPQGGYEEIDWGNRRPQKDEHFYNHEDDSTWFVMEVVNDRVNLRGAEDSAVDGKFIWLDLDQLHPVSDGTDGIAWVLVPEDHEVANIQNSVKSWF
ncbi:hypothetical protein KJ632_00470 [Patescibacteria group bacterium]|nr:hypothetical protein [Patescibacteria group bacterium]